ncbi:Mannosylfructose-phosphate synthase [Pseudobythopirellula maris]|uniref:Mannosylfructose-phosphate synthase n=1 Tax=Pseudobythopirellula maris TaxID=2527991 RepID=A0A5C5ZNN4_9BACT|nr:glycosyltransferase family 4 protein [Pseudobythopirellula maris]TWT88685.1 Mannosylfructose-phosphate synthase [Pseudobythopirellula maris]
MTNHATIASSADRREKTVAIVCNTLPPYRLHAHRRFASELEGVRLLTINTHQDATRDWSVSLPESIGLVDVSDGDRGSAGQLREWRKGGRVIDTLERERADAVVMNGYNDAGRLRTIRWCRRHGVPCFLWGDSNINSAHRGGALTQAIKRLYVPKVVAWSAGCFACGRLGKEYWEHYGADPSRVFISPYEPDYGQVWGLTDAEIDEARQRYGLAEGRRRIVYCGRLTEVKRVDLLIEAFVALAAERPDWDLVILGDGELRSELAAAVPPELKDRVVWTGFVAEQQDVSKIYRASDVLALPSRYEPWALVVNEAAAAGMAIVATDAVGAAAELVRDGVNGRVIPRDNGEALKDALLEVTAAENTDRMKAASAEVLDAWRRNGDPVEGLREALRSVGIES